jgi:hypothetical protein
VKMAVIGAHLRKRSQVDHEFSCLGYPSRQAGSPTRQIEKGDGRLNVCHDLERYHFEASAILV